MISFSAVFVKLAHVGPTTAGFYRMLFGGLILSFLSFARGMKMGHGAAHLITAFLCAVFFALDLSFWHRSIHYLGPGLATLLANFQVFFLAAIGVVALREKLTGRMVFSILLAMVGLYLIVGLTWNRFGAGYKTGVAFGLITAVCYTAYILSLRRLQAFKSAAGLSNLAVISLLTALLMGLEGWAQGERFLIPDLQSWGSLIGYGLVAQVLGWVLISTAILKLQASTVGLILLLQPTLSYLWDVLFFGKPIRGVEILGAALALVAIYLGTTNREDRGRTADDGRRERARDES